MSNKETGGPAFASVNVYTDRDGEVCSTTVEGMTLRDYFAAKAMEAYIGAYGPGNPDWRDADQWVPGKAYEMADAMLISRE